MIAHNDRDNDKLIIVNDLVMILQFFPCMWMVDADPSIQQLHSVIGLSVLADRCTDFCSTSPHSNAYNLELGGIFLVFWGRSTQFEIHVPLHGHFSTPELSKLIKN